MKKYKKYKFKNDKYGSKSFGSKKFFEIIFEKKGKKNWYYKHFISTPEWKKTILKKNKYNEVTESHYKGKTKNNKPHGKGKEIILEPRGYLDEVASFYDGEWLNGKKYGKGYWSNHHPLLGTISSADAMSPQYVVMDDFEEDEHFYYGFWKNDKKHGEGYLKNNEGIFKGEFKNDKAWKGILTKNERVHHNVGSDRYFTDKKAHVYKEYKHIINIKKGKEISRKSELLSEELFKAKSNPYKKKIKK